jgi:glycosyltransferase involved in cell wall biosynthesis
MSAPAERAPGAGSEEFLVLIPAFNEATRLPKVLAELAALREQHRVVVIDDGSRDATARIAAELGATVLRLPFNLGYGAALQTGYKYAKSRRAALIVQMDADGQHDPACIPALIAPIRRGEADLVVGSRFAQKSSYRMGRIRTLGRLLFQRIARVAGLHVTDPTSGLQAMNGSVLEVYSGDFFPSDYPDVDVLLEAYRRGLRIRECPVEMRQETRRSTLHGGLRRSSYYVYRLTLALWAGARSGNAR